MGTSQPIVDLSGIQDYIPNIAAWLGIQPATALLLLTMLVTASNLAARLIPDTAIGPLGTIRKIAKVIGMFVPNRVAPSISVNDVAKAVIARKTPTVQDAVIGEVKQIIKDQLDEKLTD